MMDVCTETCVTAWRTGLLLGGVAGLSLGGLLVALASAMRRSPDRRGRQ